jgi:hypothetical protein
VIARRRSDVPLDAPARWRLFSDSMPSQESSAIAKALPTSAPFFLSSKSAS